jgi:AraC-like DNA-binding protein
MTSLALRSPTTWPAARRPPTEGTLRVGPVMTIPDVLRSKGVDPTEVFAAAGIPLSLLDDPENTIPIRALGRLLTLCVERTGCPHFGLLTCSQAGPSTLGLVGFLVQHSPDVRSAVRSLVTHLQLHDRGAVPTLSVQGGAVTMGYAIYQKNVESQEQIYDGAMAVTRNIMRSLCGPAWRPTEVHLSRRRPADPGPYQRLFEAPVRFDAEESALVFSEKWLDHRLPGADPALHRFLQDQVEALEAQTGGAFVEQLHRLLRTRIHAGECSAASVAEMLSLHPRTLHRRLEAGGTSFRTLLEEVRFQLARDLLDNANLPLSQIAGALGYADASAFTRAFRRWAGTTPGRWRQQHRVS